METGREDYIKTGIDNKLPILQINKALSKGGFKPLTKAEEIMINDGTYGTNIFQRFGKGAKDLGGGLYTVSGMVAQAAVDPELRKGLLNKAGEYLKDKGVGGVVTDTANLMLSPYNTTVEDILTNSPADTVDNIVSGAYAHPFDATLDMLPVLGPAAGKAGKLVKRIPGVNKATDLIKRVPGAKAVSSVLPGTIENKINETINISKLTTSNIINRLDKLNTKVKGANPKDLEIAYKNLEQGRWKGTDKQVQLTKDLKELAKGIDEMNFKAGVNPNDARNLARTQYATRQLRDQGFDITNNDVRKILTDKDYKFDGVSKDKIEALYKEADTLYNQGLIVPIKHSTDTATFREGFVQEADKLKSPKAAYSRDYGTHSYEDLAKALTLNGYDRELNKLERSTKIGEVVEDIAKEVGRKVDIDNLPKLGKDEVLISPELFKLKMKQSLANSENIDNDIKALSRGLNTAEAKKYNSDLYVFNKKDLQAIEKGFTRQGGKFQSTLEPFFKRAALATPRYVIGNLTTNLGLNTVEGVNPFHHLYLIKNRDLIPDALRESTTFSGYLNKEGRLAGSPNIKDIYSQIANKYKQGNKLDKIEAIQQMTSTPFFYISGNIESRQRIANYVRQAEKYAERTGKTVDEVIREAKKNNGNNKLFRELYGKVQHSLGDYTGRNYYNPEWIQAATSMMAPFIRPYTQPARNLIYHSITNPLSNQLVMRNPARIGNEITRRGEEQGVRPNKQYGGGFPVLPAEGRYPSRVIGNPYQAYTALGELAADPAEVLGGNLSGMAPILGLSGMNRFGREASLPNQMTINGRKYQLDNNGNIADNGLLPRLKLAAAQSAQAYFAPINQMNNFVLPLIAGALGKEYRRPYDNMLFGTIGEGRIPGVAESDPTSRGRDIKETILNIYGNNYSDTYREKERLSPREIRQGRKALLRRQKKNERK